MATRTITGTTPQTEYKEVRTFARVGAHVDKTTTLARTDALAAVNSGDVTTDEYIAELVAAVVWILRELKRYTQ